MSKKGIILHLGSRTELADLAEVLDDSLSLLNSIGFQDVTPVTKESIYPDLFDQCLDLCKQITKINAEPIRTIHHLSCTGGTLITKCLAAMPNVTVLNEIDPLSTLNFKPDKPGFKADNPGFTPTDIISLARQGKFEMDQQALVQIFLSNLNTIYTQTRAKGKRLLLRDHCHSHFLTGNHIPDRPDLLSMVNTSHDTLSILTVRDPVDSYLALIANRWLHFEPKSFDEYCRRYLIFLNKHDGIPIIKYEDFVSSPQRVAKHICEILQLQYNDIFIDTFDAFKFSGDSGRSGDVIGLRMRRSIDEQFIQTNEYLETYINLINRLEYQAIT